MKYEYGVEYETNGEKPDLPDDVLVEVKMDFFDGTAYGLSGYVNWSKAQAFRIVDDRFKPKEQDMCECGLSQCPRPIKMEQDMNDWYEKGELPPVGTECEYIIGERRGYNECTFVGLNSRGSIVIEDCNGEYKSYHSHQIKFRPLPTETDKLVDEAMSLFSQTEATSDAKQGIEHAIHKLIEAGYRKVKPMSGRENTKESNDTKCPKCGAEQEVNHGGGYGSD